MTLTMLEQHLPPPYLTGAESLPCYTNALHLAALCRRKQEFTAPNVPASKTKGERSWDFCWLVLSGTALYIYQPKKSELRAHLKAQQIAYAACQRKPTQGSRSTTPNVTSTSCLSIAATTASTTASASTPSSVWLAPSEGSTSSAAAFSRTTTRHSFLSASSSTNYKLPSIDDAPPAAADGGNPRLSPATSSSATSSSSSSSLPSWMPTPISTHPPTDFSTHRQLKQYALHRATCTRAVDYLRRYFVLRVRADGQQFMVQFNSHAETLVWLETFRVSADLCLDIDERPMPEQSMYPRESISGTTDLDLHRSHSHI